MIFFAIQALIVDYCQKQNQIFVHYIIKSVSNWTKGLRVHELIGPLLARGWPAGGVICDHVDADRWCGQHSKKIVQKGINYSA